MTFEEYIAYFQDIIEHPEQYETYQRPDYLHYAKMNWARQNRWLKKFEANLELKQIISSVTEEQHWILITEPWCGDAAHSVPQIYNIVKDNPVIDLEIQLRDSEPFLIEDYLTDGSKSIPKLIIRNDVGHDKIIWGPRPEKLQATFLQMKADGRSFEEINNVLQHWYNEDKGEELQKELLALLS